MKLQFLHFGEIGKPQKNRHLFGEALDGSGQRPACAKAAHSACLKEKFGNDSPQCRSTQLA